MKKLKNTLCKLIVGIMITSMFVLPTVYADGNFYVEYVRTAAEKGFGEGTVNITPGEDMSDILGYEIYWGDDNGILTDYTSLGYVDADGKNVVSFEIKEEIMIPFGANKIYVYAKNGDGIGEEKATVEIDSAALAEKGEKQFAFWVTSDLHSGPTLDSPKNPNIRNAFNDILEVDSDAAAIIANGDNVESNTENCWKTYVKEIKNTIDDKIPMYFNVGNHELKVGEGGTYDEQIENFYEYTNQVSALKINNVYYAYKIQGQYFIHLGSQSQQRNGHADLQADQLNWLKGALNRADKENTRAYVFLHQPLKNTVSATIVDQGYGVVQDEELREIIDSHPNVIFFTGHTHRQLSSYRSAFLGGKDKPSYFNDGCVAEVSTDENVTLTGSQGLYVEVYNDKIVIHGRDFMNKKWLSTAQFLVNRYDDGGSDEETTQIKFLDSENKQINDFDTIASTDNVKVNISMSAEMMNNDEVTAIVAIYDNNGILVKTYSSEVRDFGEDVEILMGDAMDITGGSIKVMLWDTLKNMKPLCEVTEIE